MLNKSFVVTYRDSDYEEYLTTAETQEEAEKVSEELESDGYTEINIKSIRK